ncbi:hypothetical protein CLAFUW4_13599 [Fulvia fulva]|uniref:Uncharacterized protein n=1 Tax=Passalora fulva TaxID=5499 RepID=A0A9Q8PLJ5_PASFU|nr:uncharacterized protein CLAFUR5_13451 [Fulvia fulva]KAK4610590.1 hypothetical protein CLAFUR4_13602 [Fulvia fulva]KAK4611201.1 hypothetical protein CLAFUR0_13607 [Fulvia fulva]UJO24647.1 hypothetical protein CLAFUR5_13451 [Fulvia fulva]WPV21753.1 hypothetical protein CLAFUW4_13599 [Fulvia fulva]WPV37052.1 hypothetical protein CLAFUW7_13607 [Fulvia fulva]
MSTTASPSSKKCHIISIPPELRLEIYEHYFKDFELDFSNRPSPEHAGKSVSQCPLLHTCALFRTEALAPYKKYLEACNKAANVALFSFREQTLEQARGADQGDRARYELGFRDACDRVNKKRHEWNAAHMAHARELCRVDWIDFMAVQAGWVRSRGSEEVASM